MPCRDKAYDYAMLERRAADMTFTMSRCLLMPYLMLRRGRQYFDAADTVAIFDA